MVVRGYITQGIQVQWSHLVNSKVPLLKLFPRPLKSHYQGQGISWNEGAFKYPNAKQDHILNQLNQTSGGWSLDTTLFKVCHMILMSRQVWESDVEVGPRQLSV